MTFAMPCQTVAKEDKYLTRSWHAHMLDFFLSLSLAQTHNFFISPVSKHVQSSLERPYIVSGCDRFQNIAAGLDTQLGLPQLRLSGHSLTPIATRHTLATRFTLHEQLVKSKWGVTTVHPLGSRLVIGGWGGGWVLLVRVPRRRT